MKTIQTATHLLQVDESAEIKEGEHFLSSTGVIMKHNKNSYAGLISRRIVESDNKGGTYTAEKCITRAIEFADELLKQLESK